MQVYNFKIKIILMLIQTIYIILIFKLNFKETVHILRKECIRKTCKIS
jgi:hypothetical protein